MRRDPREHWRALLERYVAPDPSPDLVQRALQALLATRLHPLRRPVLPLLLTTGAALLLAGVLWPASPPRTFERALGTVIPASLALAASPTPLTGLTTFSELPDDGQALPHAMVDGAWIWRGLGGGSR